MVEFTVAGPKSPFFEMRKLMPCTHLLHLYDYCRSHEIKLSSSDLIRIVCPQCGVEEVCPSLLAAEYDVRHPEADKLAPTENESDPA
jgi:hypothetical protein